MTDYLKNVTVGKKYSVIFVLVYPAFLFYIILRYFLLMQPDIS